LFVSLADQIFGDDLKVDVDVLVSLFPIFILLLTIFLERHCIFDIYVGKHAVDWLTISQYLAISLIITSVEDDHDLMLAHFQQSVVEDELSSRNRCSWILREL